MNAVWQRARASGAYGFSADVTQTDTPQASIFNVGRSNRQTALYIEGRTDLDNNSLEMRLWSGGGSVQLPESAVEMKIADGAALARRGHEPWQEIDGFNNLFAPGGDFLSYTHAAKNVTRHGPERLETAMGPVDVTRFTFDVDGRAYALQMHQQMQQQALREGLPPNVRLEVPKLFSQMSGQGELWVGTNGLPLRQMMHLQFPADASSYRSSSAITVNFFDFAQSPTQRAASLWHWGVSQRLAAFSTPQAPITLLVLTLLLFFSWLVLMRRRARLVYAS
ncbi:MAG: hypothetical protein KDE46_07405, partial [Caldilineaceae bacterium]|nr:hypothetical protein [Caldilineaceae bacterium]